MARISCLSHNQNSSLRQCKCAVHWLTRRRVTWDGLRRLDGVTRTLIGQATVSPDGQCQPRGDHERRTLLFERMDRWCSCQIMKVNCRLQSKPRQRDWESRAWRRTRRRKRQGPLDGVKFVAEMFEQSSGSEFDLCPRRELTYDT